MRFMANYALANAIESQRRLREQAERERLVRQRPRR
jgi:hypothetical protein